MGRRDELIDSFLRFYTSKSISFASFLVGSIFGLFTVLSILKSTTVSSGQFGVLTATYATIFLFGGYCMFKYGYYAVLAEKTLKEIEKMRTDPLYQPSLPKREDFLRWVFRLSQPRKIIWLGFIYFIVALGAYLAASNTLGSTLHFFTS